MAMDLVHLVEQVKQKIGGMHSNVVDANMIYEELEQHNFREDSVQFVASSLTKRYGATANAGDVCAEELPVAVNPDEKTCENKNKPEGSSASSVVDGSVSVSCSKEQQEAAASPPEVSLRLLGGLQADVKVEMGPCSRKVDKLQVREPDTSAGSVPSSSGMSGAVDLPSSSSEVGTFSPAVLDFDYDVNNNDPNNNTEYEMIPDPVSSSMNDPTVAVPRDEEDYYNDVQIVDQEQIREKLLNETRIIHTVVPQHTFGEIYSFLESNLDNENRLQVVMKYFLNQDFPNMLPAMGSVGKNVLGTGGCGSAAVSIPDTSRPAVPDSNTQEANCRASASATIPATSRRASAVMDAVDPVVVLSDSDALEAESDVELVQEKNSDVIYVDSVNKSRKRLSLGKTEVSSSKKTRTDSCNSNSADTKVIDLSLNVTKRPRGTHKHLDTVKEMFPNLGDKHLARVCSLYGETDDDLVKIIDDLLQNVNSLGNLCEPVVEPLVSLRENSSTNENSVEPPIAPENKVSESDVAEYLAVKHAGGAEQKQNCITVFQQASSEHPGPSFFLTPGTCNATLAEVTVQPPTCSYVPSYVRDARVTVDGGEGRPACARVGVAKANRSTVITSSKEEKVAAIVAETCARFVAQTPAVLTVPKTGRTKLSLTGLSERPCGVHIQSNNKASPCGNCTAAQVREPSRKKRKKVLKQTGETAHTHSPEGGAAQGEPSTSTSLVASAVATATPPPSGADQPSTSGTRNNTVVAPGNSTEGELAAPGEASTQDQQQIDDCYECLLSIFPQADPTYLLDKCIEIGNNEEQMRQFIADALEKKDYPTYQDYQKRMEEEKQKKKVTTEFSVESFLEIFPDPAKYFLEQKKEVHTELGLVFLKNRYPRTRCCDISNLFKSCKYNLTRTCQMLDNVKTAMKSKRALVIGLCNKIDLQFLQEVAFIENWSVIEEYIKDKASKKNQAFEEAKARQELLECACCFSDEVLLEDIGTCDDGHLFCRDCIQRSAEVQIGDGKTKFPCLTTCDSEFSLKTLQKFLKASMLSKVLQTRQMEEVKAASIDGIEYCPHCNFATILPEEDKVFHCLNPECMKETCRMCHEPNHIPKRCDEVEKSDEVKARTYIENKMTEALIRVCWKCQKSFIKEDGCNKMTCSCGAMMCYICRQRVLDYTHFNGQGGTEYNKCPLYSTNDELHVEVVKREALRAKQEVMQQNPGVWLKHDPTMVLPEATNAPPMPGFPRERNLDRAQRHGEAFARAYARAQGRIRAELQYRFYEQRNANRQNPANRRPAAREIPVPGMAPVPAGIVRAAGGLPHEEMQAALAAINAVLHRLPRGAGLPQRAVAIMPAPMLAHPAAERRVGVPVGDQFGPEMPAPDEALNLVVDPQQHVEELEALPPEVWEEMDVDAQPRL